MDAFLMAYDDDVEKLVIAIENFSRTVPGASFAHESIGASAALAGEAIFQMIDIPLLDLKPGESLYNPYMGDYLMGGAEYLANAPEVESPLNLLRVLLEEKAYPIQDYTQNLKSFVDIYRGKAESPDDKLFLTLPSHEMPKTASFRAAGTLRPTLDDLTQNVMGEELAEARYMLSTAALAKVLDKNRSNLPPHRALPLACETLLVMAKTVPFPEPQREDLKSLMPLLGVRLQ